MLLDIGETVFRICDELEFSDTIRNKIKLARAGGGDPAKDWLKNLQQNNGDITSEEFNTALINCNLRLPKSMRKQDESPNFHFVSELTYQNINDLSLLLSEDNVWRSVALELEICIEKIELIQRRQMRPNTYSCAELLFREIDQKMPEYSVKDFMILLKKLHIINAYNHMKQTVKEWAKKKLSTR